MGYHFLFPGDLPEPGIKPTTLGSPASPALAGGFFTREPPGKPQMKADSLESSPQSCLPATVPQLGTVTGIHETGRVVASPIHGCDQQKHLACLSHHLLPELIFNLHLVSLFVSNFVSLPRLRRN